MQELIYLGGTTGLSSAFDTATVNAVVKYMNVSKRTAQLLLSSAGIFGKYAFDLSIKGLTKKQIRDKGGYDSDTKKFTKGIAVYFYLVDGTRVEKLESWTGSAMSSLPGYRGTFYH